MESPVWAQGTLTGYARHFKRVFDVVVSTALLVIAAPLFPIISITLALSQGRPILFRHKRPGRLGRPFILYKFRTMTDGRDANGELLPDADRMTTIGRFLRQTSLDELPQLFNVLKGEMSLVGPRPLRMEYLELYTREQARRHDVRPGITGWAQVNGRNAISWEDKFRYDVWYVDNWSFGLDIKILWLTLLAVLKRQGVSREGYATTPRFTGSGDRMGAPGKGEGSIREPRNQPM